MRRTHIADHGNEFKSSLGIQRRPLVSDCIKVQLYDQRLVLGCLVTNKRAQTRRSKRNCIPQGQWARTYLHPRFVFRHIERHAFSRPSLAFPRGVHILPRYNIRSRFGRILALSCQYSPLMITPLSTYYDHKGHLKRPPTTRHSTTPLHPECPNERTTPRRHR